MASTAPEFEYTVDVVAAEAKASLQLQQWLQTGRELAQVDAIRQRTDTAQQFTIGDWLLAGENQWQKKAYKEAQSIFHGHGRATLRNLAYVAKHVPVSLRNDALSWNHHCVVAKLGTEQQKHWLNDAIANGWSSKQLRRELRACYQRRSQIFQPQSKTIDLTISLSQRQLAGLRKAAKLFKKYHRRHIVKEDLARALLLHVLFDHDYIPEDSMSESVAEDFRHVSSDVWREAMDEFESEQRSKSPAQNELESGETDACKKGEL